MRERERERGEREREGGGVNGGGLLKICCRKIVEHACLVAVNGMPAAALIHS